MDRLETDGPDAAGLDPTPDVMWETENAPGDAGRWARAGGAPSGDEGDRVDQAASDGPTLREHLFSQLRVACDHPTDLLIGIRLIDLIDEAGYLPSDLTNVATQLGCEPVAHREDARNFAPL